MLQEFKKFSLNKNDFSVDQVEKINESIISPAYSTYEFIGKPEISTQKDKICYEQYILLKDKTSISMGYMILNSYDNATKCTNYCVADTANIAHVLWHGGKDGLGLAKNDVAYFYDESHSYGLVFQCRNISIGITVRSEEKKKEEIT